MSRELRRRSGWRRRCPCRSRPAHTTGASRLLRQAPSTPWSRGATPRSSGPSTPWSRGATPRSSGRRRSVPSGGFARRGRSSAPSRSCARRARGGPRSASRGWPPTAQRQERAERQPGASARRGPPRARRAAVPDGSEELRQLRIGSVFGATVSAAVRQSVFSVLPVDGCSPLKQTRAWWAVVAASQKVKIRICPQARPLSRIGGGSLLCAPVSAAPNSWGGVVWCSLSAAAGLLWAASCRGTRSSFQQHLEGLGPFFGLLRHLLCPVLAMLERLVRVSPRGITTADISRRRRVTRRGVQWILLVVSSVILLPGARAHLLQSEAEEALFASRLQPPSNISSVACPRTENQVATLASSWFPHPHSVEGCGLPLSFEHSGLCCVVLFQIHASRSVASDGGCV